MNLLFCGTTDSSKSRSWGFTNSILLNNIQTKVNVPLTIDYNIHSRIILKPYQYLNKMVRGDSVVRDGLFNFISEQKLKKGFKKNQNNIDVVFHSGCLSIPKQFENRMKHFLYTDATIKVGLEYGSIKRPEKYLEIYKKYTDVYEPRLTAIFTFNQWTKDSLIKDFGYNEDKIYNVGFGANLKPYNGLKDYTNNLMLLVLRRGLEEIKGLNLLLKAFKIAKQKNSKIKLVVVGTTADDIDGVEYYEGYPREKTIELFQQASLYTMPALMESNGMVYPEALSCKTPILGLNRLAFPEFAGYGKYGFIVKEPDPELVANTILDAMSDPKRLEQMGIEGQKFATERYNWDNVVDRMLDIIEKYNK